MRRPPGLCGLRWRAAFAGYDLHTPKTLKEKPNSPMGFFPLFSFEITVCGRSIPDLFTGHSFRHETKRFIRAHGQDTWKLRINTVCQVTPRNGNARWNGMNADLLECLFIPACKDNVWRFDPSTFRGLEQNTNLKLIKETLLRFSS
jgi:hypothetical protein